MCRHVSSSKLMFPNSVDINLQWICCWFPATAGQLKSFCRSPLPKWLLINGYCEIVWVTGLSPPSCMHHPTSAFTAFSQCSQPCPPTTHRSPHLDEDAVWKIKWRTLAYLVLTVAILAEQMVRSALFVKVINCPENPKQLCVDPS